MCVHPVEGVEQALAPLLVEAADRHAQFADRLGQIGLLRREFYVLAFDRSQFILGAQVDAAHALAILFEAGEPRGNLIHRRRGFALLDAGQGGQALRRAFQLFRDVADEQFQPLLRRLRLSLQPGAGFARRAHRLQSRPRRALGFGQFGFRHGAGVAGLL